MEKAKIIIGNDKNKDKKETDIVTKNTNIDSSLPENSPEPIQGPVCENVWGNEYTVANVLDEQQKAERRLFVRVIYIQNIECNKTLKNIDDEPTILKDPVKFMVVDISMGGIGIISEQPVNVGTILVFKLELDYIVYEIKCEVVYCFLNDGKYRAGLKVAEKDKDFIKHLKILIARLSLQSMYGVKLDTPPQNQ